MLKLLHLLTEILFRLKELPGLSFLGTYYYKMRDTHEQIKKKIKAYETKKGNIEGNLQRAKEIPTLIKGSKKKKS